MKKGSVNTKLQERILYSEDNSKHVINLFMWGFQLSYLVSIKGSAENLFNTIDSMLRPKIFLLGILLNGREDRHLVCLEPEDCGYSVKSFSNIHKIAKELSEIDEERNIFHSHPAIQEQHEKKIIYKTYLETVRKILRKENFGSDSEIFISFPSIVDDYLVFVVLELNKEAMSKYYSLTKDTFLERYKISRSFIESVADAFLKSCTNSLKDPEPGAGLDALGKQTDELLRDAGQQFMYTFSQAGNNFHGLHGLYEACNTIASLKYEGAEGLGKMVVARKDHPNIKMTLQLDEPIKIRDFRKVRKFLELSKGDSLIISDSYFIYGLGKLMGKYNPRDESLFIISFTQHYQWEILHDNNLLMKVEYRQPNLPKDKIDREKFYSDLKRIFIGIDKSKIDLLWEIIIEGTKQKHGTTLVISDIAKMEANRLGNQSFKLMPFKMNSEIIQQITSIDGAVLLDTEGFCHAIGVILDGLATLKGDSSRGARYNSAIRYYEYKGLKNPTVIVIISEDGMINLIPNLKPQIKHSLIIDNIKRLKTLSRTKKIDRKEFYKYMDWFKKIEFYLTEKECNLINELRKNIEMKDEDNGSMRIILEDLKPNNEMNKSYYLKE